MSIFNYPCNQTPCVCTSQCPPAQCTDGCVDDVKTDCVQLSADLNLCGVVTPKGTTLTVALENIKNILCGDIDAPQFADIAVRASGTDTTASHLWDKITTSNAYGTQKTLQNTGSNENILLKIKLSTSTGDNALVLLADGLYMAPSSAGITTLSEVYSTTIALTVTPVTGGHTIKADAKISAVVGNSLIDNGGLYVPTPTPVVQRVVSGGTTQSITTTSTLLGNIYTVLGELRIDPASTAPISVTADGLRVDCCVPVIPTNTPLVANDSSLINFTTSGTDNHTLTATIVPAGTNGYVLTTTGGNVVWAAATGSGSGAPTQLIDTTLINVTLVSSSPDVYSMTINPGTNGQVLTTVAGVTAWASPVTCTDAFGLKIWDNGTNYMLSFAADGLTNTSYEAEVQGYSGTAWVTATYSSTSGGDLIYIMGGNTVNGVFTARVRRSCGGGVYSSWTSLTFDTLAIQNLTYSNADGNLLFYTDPADDSNILVDINIPAGTDVWTNIPGGWLQSGITADGTYIPQYKISSNKKHVYFRGALNTNVSIASGTPGFTATNKNLLDLTSLLALLDPSVTASYVNVPTISWAPDTATIITDYKLYTGASLLILGVESFNTSGSAHSVNGISLSPFQLN